MKDHSKIGNRPGKPTYRTPALFRYRQYLKIGKSKAKNTSGQKNPIRKNGVFDLF